MFTHNPSVAVSSVSKMRGWCDNFRSIHHRDSMDACTYRRTSTFLFSGKVLQGLQTLTHDYFSITGLEVLLQNGEKSVKILC